MTSWRHRNVVLNFFRLSLFLKDIITVDLFINKLVSAAFKKLYWQYTKCCRCCCFWQLKWRAQGQVTVIRKSDLTAENIEFDWAERKTLVVTYDVTHPASRAYYCILEWGREKKAIHDSRQTFEVAEARLLDWSIVFSLVQLVLPVRASVTEPALPLYRFYYAWYLTCIPPTSSACSTKDLTRFMKRKSKKRSPTEQGGR